MTIDTFAGCEGTKFRLNCTGAAPLELILKSVTPIQVGGARPAGRATPFTLEFRSEGTLYARQGSYLLSHDQLGDFELFLVPHGREGNGTIYQAIFN